MNSVNKTPQPTRGIAAFRKYHRQIRRCLPETRITIADLTGVAVQDIEVANMVAKAYLNQNKPGK